MIPIETAVQGIKNGEVKLFEVVIENFQQQLFHYCFHMLNNVQEAEDAVQESFLKAFEKIESYGSSISFSAWLYKITYNHCINIIRRKKLLSFIPFMDEADTGNAGIETKIEENEYGKALSDALGKISPTDRSVFIFRVLEERPYDEIGKILKISSANARKKYERAKRKMKAFLTVKEGGIVNEGFSIS